MAIGRMDAKCHRFVPENLTMSQVADLGQRYLKQRRLEAKSLFGNLLVLFHQNKSIAIKIYQYDGYALNHYHHWRFLADCYALLATPRGDLGDAIIHLFRYAFNQNGSFDKKMHAYQLIRAVDRTNDILNAECHVPNITQKNMSDALHYIISDYYAKAVLTNAQEKSEQSTLSAHQLDRQYTTMQEIVADVSSYDELTISKLSQLGTLFLSTIDLSSRSQCSAALVGIDAAIFLENVSGPASPYSCWMLLAQAYARLSECTGELSQAIMMLFNRVFDCAIGTINPGVIIHPIRVEPELVSLAMKGIVRQHVEYSNKIQEEKTAAYRMM